MYIHYAALVWNMERNRQICRSWLFISDLLALDVYVNSVLALSHRTNHARDKEDDRSHPLRFCIAPLHHHTSIHQPSLVSSSHYTPGRPILATSLTLNNIST